MFGKPIDFLAIGDIATDAFIRIKDAHLTCAVDKVACEICLKFADKVPFESVTVVPAVGNSANAAVAAARLGLSSALVSDIGDDKNGKDCLEQLKREKVNSKHITRHAGMKTNYHFVLWYSDERTILVNHQKYPYHLAKISSTPRWIYLSSLGGNSEDYHHEIVSYLENHPTVKLTFQPGTFQMSLGVEKLSKLYKRTELFICNVEEAERILGMSAGENRINISSLLKGLHALGPKMISITDGPKGAYFFHEDMCYFMPPYPDPKPPLERTGAGDAYASTFVAALILGKNPLEALRWGPVNSMSVVQYVGAQQGLLPQSTLEDLLAAAPADYKPRKL